MSYFDIHVCITSTTGWRCSKQPIIRGRANTVTVGEDEDDLFDGRGANTETVVADLEVSFADQIPSVFIRNVYKYVSANPTICEFLAEGGLKFGSKASLDEFEAELTKSLQNKKFGSYLGTFEDKLRAHSFKPKRLNGGGKEYTNADFKEGNMSVYSITQKPKGSASQTLTKASASQILAKAHDNIEKLTEDQKKVMELMDGMMNLIKQSLPNYMNDLADAAKRTDIFSTLHSSLVQNLAVIQTKAGDIQDGMVAVTEDIKKFYS